MGWLEGCGGGFAARFGARHAADRQAKNGWRFSLTFWSRATAVIRPEVLEFCTILVLQSGPRPVLRMSVPKIVKSWLALRNDLVVCSVGNSFG